MRYDVRVPFWSGDAVKQRYLALPDDASAQVANDGVLDLPVGAVLVKQFMIADRPVETRLFMKYRERQWAGYSYVWDAEGRDARLSTEPEVVTRDWDGRTWTYPTRSDCMGCHNGDRGLGLEVGQLDLVREFPETGRMANQLATFQRIGLISGDVPSFSRLPTSTSDAPLAARARAYLHSNCAICHTRQGPTPVDLDLRATIDLEATGLCEAPREGDMGVEGARRLFPGTPEKSVVSLRMRATGKGHMPPIGPQHVDSEGAALIDAWIASLRVCP